MGFKQQIERTRTLALVRLVRPCFCHKVVLWFRSLFRTLYLILSISFFLCLILFINIFLLLSFLLDVAYISVSTIALFVTYNSKEQTQSDNDYIFLIFHELGLLTY